MSWWGRLKLRAVRFLLEAILDEVLKERKLRKEEMMKLDRKTLGFALKALAKIGMVWAMVLTGETALEAAGDATVSGAKEIGDILLPWILSLAVDWLGSAIKSSRKPTPA